MKKKYKIVILLVIVLAILIIIPIVTFSNRKVPLENTSQESTAEKNEKQRQKLLDEKKEFQNNAENGMISNGEMYTESKISEEEVAKYKEERRVIEEKENKIKEIMNRYYKEEFEKALKDVEKESVGMVSTKNPSITQGEYEIYEIMLKVLEEENLTTDERNVIKEFLKTQESTIALDKNFKTRYDNVMK